MRRLDGQDRASAIAWAKAMVANGGTLYLDTETTGFGHDAEIVEVAIIDANGRTLFESLVRPNQAIPTDATRIHGITDAMVRNAPFWPEVYPQVHALLENASGIVVYNAAFDRRIIDQVNRRAGLVSARAKWGCAMLQYAAYAGVWNAKYGNWRWHKLERAARDFGLTYNGAHRALADARMCRSVVAGMATHVP